MAPFEITWQAQEFERQEKGVSWYWISILVAVCILAFAVWQKNFFFALFVVIAEILFIVWGSRTPRTFSFALDEKGLRIGEKTRYSYESLRGFHLEKDAVPGWSELTLYSQSRLRPSMTLYVPKEKVDVVAKICRHFLPEVELQFTFLDALERFMRF